MADKIARRSSNDPKWQKVKELVDARDRRQCQFMKCLSITEAHQLKVSGSKTLDRAHIFSAAHHPEKIYNINNIITLQRFIHERMDKYQNPLNGDTIDLNEHYWWWIRIKSHKVDKYDPEIDYEYELSQLIN